MRIMHIVGARPNFMKVAPIIAEMNKHQNVFEQVLVHTEQHYDAKMSEVFFKDLGMPVPDECLGVGSGSHANQTARIMMAFEPVLVKYPPDWVLVVGDVNSTLACALVAAKLGVKVVHVEAGLRSNDWSMPEEINRVITDRISDLMLTPSEDGNHNLAKEGVEPAKVSLVGNVMIDSLVRLLPIAKQKNILDELGISRESYVLVTLHRPANVDNPNILKVILDSLEKISTDIPVIFPVHPRTRKAIKSILRDNMKNGIHFVEPLGYLDFLCLTDSSRAVITDSGGIQEETSFLGVPCLTVRPNTERPVTISLGTNQLVDACTSSILSEFSTLMDKPSRQQCDIPLWDGCTAQRIVSELIRRN